MLDSDDQGAWFAFTFLTASLLLRLCTPAGSNGPPRTFSGRELSMQRLQLLVLFQLAVPVFALNALKPVVLVEVRPRAIESWTSLDSLGRLLLEHSSQRSKVLRQHAHKIDGYMTPKEGIASARCLHRCDLALAHSKPRPAGHNAHGQKLESEIIEPEMWMCRSICLRNIAARKLLSGAPQHVMEGFVLTNSLQRWEGYKLAKPGRNPESLKLFRQRKLLSQGIVKPFPVGTTNWHISTIVLTRE
ncbi:hypothetical protein B0H10DRAFT_1966919 [Mycena sp. CBHHK59/15]|nr:hypothetical protein B0H10DRAFT_1966919 [Mycena sp. CBHHK59/15]